VRRKEWKKRLPPFVALTWDILHSDAYKDLTGSAGKALPYFLGKVQKSYRDPERYERGFHFTYREAEKYGFTRRTFFRIIGSLIEKGFIDPIERGGLKGLHGGYSRFKISRRWEKYGRWDFEKKDWNQVIPKRWKV
jgi:hypothetical protein